MNEDQTRGSNPFEEQAREQGQYEYRFQSGSFDPNRGGFEPTHSQNGKGFWRSFLAVALCVVLSFCAGVGGTMLTLEGYEKKQAENSIHQAPSADSLHDDDPEGLLTRDEMEYSPYGSAGENAFAISEVVRMVEDSVVVIQASVGSGSGVIIHEDGYILTCHHVVDGARSVTVQLSDGVSTYAAALVGSDESSDLAVLKIQPAEGKPLTAAKHGKSSYLVKGEAVVAIGNPLGTLGGSVTNGIISSTERTIQTENGNMTLLQTNAAINSGNSGGGLFNLKGELVGIVNAKYAATGVEGLAFAIPIDAAYEVECDLIEYGYVRGIIDHGISTVEINEENLSYYYYRFNIQKTGLYVVSSKYDANLENRDRITAVNGKAVETEADFDAAIQGCAVGDVIVVEYEKSGGGVKTAEITLREYIPDSAMVDFS